MTLLSSKDSLSSKTLNIIKRIINVKDVDIEPGGYLQAERQTGPETMEQVFLLTLRSLQSAHGTETPVALWRNVQNSLKFSFIFIPNGLISS